MKGQMKLRQSIKFHNLHSSPPICFLRMSIMLINLAISVGVYAIDMVPSEECVELIARGSLRASGYVVQLPDFSRGGCQ